MDGRMTGTVPFWRKAAKRFPVIMPLPGALIPFLAYCHHRLLARRLLMTAIDPSGEQYVALMKPA